MAYYPSSTRQRELVSRCFWSAAALIILLCFDAAYACTCVPNSPPCGAYGDASTIFVGRVTSSAQRKRYTDRDGKQTVYDVGSIRFLVQEPFKGVSGNQLEIHSGTGGGDCGYWFIRGEVYLVYAYKSSEDNKFYTSICTRTRPVSEAREDLEFLRSLSAAQPGGMLFGKLRRVIGDKEHGPSKEGPAMSGIHIVIEGVGQSFEAITNKDGEYQLAGLPPGDYDAHPVLPDELGATAGHDIVDRFGSYSGHKKVSIIDRSCAEMSFTVQFNGLVKGKVIDAKGEPVKDVQVNLVWADNFDKEWSAWTNEEGNYEFHMVQPGNYLLGFNLSWAPSLREPYPRSFYPGVNDKSEAGLIVIGEGTKLTGYDLTMPPRFVEREVKLSVFWPDGRPAGGASVHYYFDYPGRSWDETATADEQGNVTLKLFDEQRYTIFAAAEMSRSTHAEAVEVTVADKMKPLKFVLDKAGNGYDYGRTLKRNKTKQSSP